MARYKDWSWHMPELKEGETAPDMVALLSLLMDLRDIQQAQLVNIQQINARLDANLQAATTPRNETYPRWRRFWS